MLQFLTKRQFHWCLAWFYPVLHQHTKHNSCTHGVEEAKQEASKSEDKQEIDHQDLYKEQAEELEVYQGFEEDKEILEQEQDKDNFQRIQKNQTNF